MRSYFGDTTLAIWLGGKNSLGSHYITATNVELPEHSFCGTLGRWNRVNSDSAGFRQISPS